MTNNLLIAVVFTAYMALVYMWFGYIDKVHPPQ